MPFISMALLFIVLLHAVVLIDSLVADELQYMRYAVGWMADAQTVVMKNENPIISFKARCWHHDDKVKVDLTTNSIHAFRRLIGIALTLVAANVH